MFEQDDSRSSGVECVLLSLSARLSSEKLKCSFNVFLFLSAVVFVLVSLGGGGGLVVERRTCDLAVVGSRPGRDAAA